MKRKKQTTGESRGDETEDSSVDGAKNIELVTYEDNNEPVVQTLNLAPRTKVIDAKTVLGYSAKDSLIRANGKEVLKNQTDLHKEAEDGEKFIITRFAGMGGF